MESFDTVRMNRRGNINDSTWKLVRSWIRSKKGETDTSETSFGLEPAPRTQRCERGWVFLSFSSRETISGGIKPIDFVPIMGIREAGPLISRKRRYPQSVSASHFLVSYKAPAIVGITCGTLHFYSSAIHPDTQLSFETDIDIPAILFDNEFICLSRKLQLSFCFFSLHYIISFEKKKQHFIDLHKVEENVN